MSTTPVTSNLSRSFQSMQMVSTRHESVLCFQVCQIQQLDLPKMLELPPVQEPAVQELQLIKLLPLQQLNLIDQNLPRQEPPFKQMPINPMFRNQM